MSALLGTGKRASIALALGAGAFDAHHLAREDLELLLS